MATYSDAFTRANEPLASATWYSSNADYPSILSNAVYNYGTGGYIGTYRSALAGGRVKAQITLTTKGTSSPYGGPIVGMNTASPTPNNGQNTWNAFQAAPFYRFVAKSTGYQLQKKQASVGTFDDIGSQYATTPANGDVMRIEYDENTGVVKGYVDGTLRCSYTDPSPATGGRYAGFFITAATTVDLWSAEDLVDAPVASFTKNVASGEAPLTVNFTDTSTNTPTSWLWDFGDGTTSTSQNPSHQYPNAGTYSVILTATNAGGSDASPSQTVTVSNPVATGRIKAWTGSAWAPKPLKVRIGTSWVDKTSGAKVWDGDSWVALDGAGTDPPTPTQGTIKHSTAGFAGFQNCVDLAPVGIHGAPLLLTAGDVAGIARSDDGGAYWWSRNSYVENVGPRKNMSGVHWSRYTAGRAWALFGGYPSNSTMGVAKSTDYGQTFAVAWSTGAASGINPECGGDNHPRQVGRMILEGANGYVYIGTRNGVWRSTNGGSTFAAWVLAGTKVTGIVEDPVDNTMLYVSTVEQTNPGVHAVNVSTGASTRYALGDAQDLVAVDVEGVTNLYVAAGLQGVRRWVRSGSTTSAISSGWTTITGAVPTGDVTTLTASEAALSTNTSLAVTSTTGWATSGGGYIGDDKFSWTSITSTTLNGVTWPDPSGNTYVAGVALAEGVNGGSPGRWCAVDAVYSGGDVVVMVGAADKGSWTAGNLGTSSPGFKTVWRATDGLAATPTWVEDTSNFVLLGMVGETGTPYYAWEDDVWLRLNGSTADVSQLRIDPANVEVVYASGRNCNSKRVDASTRWRPASRGHNAWIGHEVSSDAGDSTKVLTSAVDWGVIASTARFETGHPIMTDLPTSAAYAIKVGSNGKGYVAAANRDNAAGGEGGNILVNDDPWATPLAWTSTGLGRSGLGRACGVAMTLQSSTVRLAAFVNTNSGSADPQGGFWYKNGSAAWVRCPTLQGAFAKSSAMATGATVPIMVSADSPGTMYAMLYWDGLWRTTDYGQTWARVWAKTASDWHSVSIAIDEQTANRIAVTTNLELWVITNAHDGTLNANGTTLTGTIAATKNSLGGVQKVAARPDGRIFALTTGPGDTRMHTSTTWSAFTALNVGKVGEGARLATGMHATTDRVYVVADGEGLLVVTPGV